MNFQDVGIKVNQTPGKYYIACPECGPKREHKDKKSLTVNVESGNNWWKCHNCTFSGNLEIIEKYSEVHKKANLPKKQPDTYPVEIRGFLERKGISVDTAKAEHIYEHTSKKGVIAFPYYRNMALVNVMFRDLIAEAANGKKKLWQIPREDGSEMVFWGLNKYNKEYRYNNKPFLLICEGQTDRLTYLEAGFQNILSVPQGAPAANAKNVEKALEYLKDPDFNIILKEVLKEGGDVYISTDGDEVGIALRELLSQHIGKEHVRLVRYPEGYKDANEILVGDKKTNLMPKGKEGVGRLISSAQPYPLFGIVRVRDVIQEINRNLEFGEERGLGCGEETYDKYIRFVNSKLYVLTGISGHYKSRWLRDYQVKLIKNNPDSGLRIACFSPEMMPPRKEARAWAEVYMGKPMKYEWNHSYEMTPDQRLESLMWVDQRMIIINPTLNSHEKSFGKDFSSLDGILRYAEHLVRSEGIQMLNIDAWNKLEHDEGRLSTTNYVSKALDKIHNFDAKHGVSTFLVAHPTKMGAIGGKYNNPNKVMPTLDDISGSGNFYNKADMGIVTYVEKYYMTGEQNENGQYIWKRRKDAPVMVRVEKAKDPEIGEENDFYAKSSIVHGNRFSVVKNREEDLKMQPAEDETY